MKLDVDLPKIPELGIMQGRLIDPPNGDDLDWFPFDNWEQEFSIAQSLSLNSIELVIDRKMSSNNPLWTQIGREKINELYTKHTLKPIACCVNFVIDNSIYDDAILEKIKDVIKYVSELDFKFVIIPLFGLSEFKLDVEKQLKTRISLLSKYANDNNIDLLIESNLTGNDTLGFLSKLENKNVGVVYDVGNATACGHNIEYDLDILSEMISHIHIKDKILSGENVPLGEGIVNFTNIFNILKKNNYDGAFTLETSRGMSATSTASNNINYIKQFFHAY